MSLMWEAFAIRSFPGIPKDSVNTAAGGITGAGEAMAHG